MNELANHKIRFGKLVDDNAKLPFSWKKLSIFFDLPYWKDNLLRHNLDVMHNEKNICESILTTLLNIDRKIKDTFKSHLYLLEMVLQSDLENYKVPTCHWF